MDPIYEKIARYEKAFDHYQKREFLEAKPIFEELIAFHQDGPSITMLERTNTYLEKGCPDNWEGHYRATEK